MTKVWFDDDMIELQIDVSDGCSLFSNEVYVAYQTLDRAISDLSDFKKQIYGGLLDIRFGEFRPEWANGAFHARLHFSRLGKLFITCRMESDYKDFSKKNVASKATLYLKTAPALLDRFIDELKTINEKQSNEATLEGI